MAPLNDRDLAELRQWAQDAMESAKATLERMKNEKRARAEFLAGPYWKDMIATPSNTLRYLSHPEPTVREAVLYVLAERSDLVADFPNVCEHMALNDADQKVRNRAYSFLGSFLANRKDRTVGRKLAEIVDDDSEPIENRKFAYMALLEVFGRLRELAPFVDRGTSFEEMVDWDFVRGMLA